MTHSREKYRTDGRQTGQTDNDFIGPSVGQESQTQNINRLALQNDYEMFIYRGTPISCFL